MRALRARVAAVLTVAALAGGACSKDAEPAPVAEPSPTSSALDTSSSAAPAAPPTSAAAVPRPRVGTCHRLTYALAVAPTVDGRPVACGSRHTSVTFATGRLDTVVDGHLLAVDSEHVQRQVRRTCPARLRTFLGGSVDDRRLSMLRAVWFTPSLAEADAGADWFRCDVVALAADEELSPLRGGLEGALGDPARRSRYAMCGTAEPGTPEFERVVCSTRHAWRAVDTVALGAGGWPGEAAVRRAGQGRCEDVGRARAEDPLQFGWGYEWPTAAQWEAGQRYGLCWVPD